MPEPLGTMAGHYPLGLNCYGLSLESALQNMTKMNKESIDLGRLYQIRELTEFCGAIYRTALNWVQLGEIDSVKIGGTYLITGESIKDRLN